MEVRVVCCRYKMSGGKARVALVAAALLIAASAAIIAVYGWPLIMVYAENVARATALTLRPLWPYLRPLYSWMLKPTIVISGDLSGVEKIIVYPSGEALIEAGGQTYRVSSNRTIHYTLMKTDYKWECRLRCGYAYFMEMREGRTRWIPKCARVCTLSAVVRPVEREVIVQYVRG